MSVLSSVCCSIYGRFDFSIRQYILRDPEAFKRIAIKDFDYFEDHRVLLDGTGDELFVKSLFNMSGETWRQMRATLSPAFTGSKMRQMFELISECADDVVTHFQKRVANGEKVHIEMKDFFSRYTNDVIATCAFGVKVNSLDDPDNDFYKSGLKLTNFASGFINSLKFLLLVFIPRIAQLLKLKFFDKERTAYFKDMIMDTMDTRQKNNIIRPDVVNMLMQVRQGKIDQQQSIDEPPQTDGFATVEESHIGQATVTRKWSDTEIVAQCFLFFFAGFEISSTILSLTAYELVANPDVQRKLYEEIAEVNKSIQGKRIGYDTLQKMKYMDQVISEVLRKWPGNGQTDRLCVKDYIFDDGDKLKFKIEKGSSIIIPIYGIHRDPKYYPNPEKFDPERFSDENKDKIQPGTYLPFGSGPRNCIGMSEFISLRHSMCVCVCVIAD